MKEWDGKPPKGGWHWLRRCRDGQLRMAYWGRFAGDWRVADAAARTVITSETKVARLFEYVVAVDEPHSGADAGS